MVATGLQESLRKNRTIGQCLWTIAGVCVLIQTPALWKLWETRTSPNPGRETGLIRCPKNTGPRGKTGAHPDLLRLAIHPGAFPTFGKSNLHGIRRAGRKKTVSAVSSGKEDPVCRVSARGIRENGNPVSKNARWGRPGIISSDHDRRTSKTTDGRIPGDMALSVQTVGVV